jgi:hypothetical protein
MIDKTENEIESPPILKKWSRLYWAVMINLVGWLLIFFIFRKVFE